LIIVEKILLYKYKFIDMAIKAPQEKKVPEIKMPGETTQKKLDELQAELEQTQDKERRKIIRSEILSIRRAFNRTKQYTEIANNKLAEGKNNLDDISAVNLLKIDKEISKERRGEFLSKSFLHKQTSDAEGNAYQEPLEAEKIKE
jgi:hypothetical protein